MTTNDFKKLIPKVCKANTSKYPEDWISENPTQGHCAIVSVLAQDLFGGDIVRVPLLGTPYEVMKSHYFNIINGKEYDFTLSQFKENPYLGVKRESISKEKILSSPDTKKRYDLLKKQFIRY